MEANNRDPNAEKAVPLTKAVVLICIIAGSAGLMFGYDLAVSGGVSVMAPFLEKFFPSVLAKMAMAKPDQYCIYDSHAIALFTSSLFLAGLVASLLAGRVTTVIGRKHSLTISGILFLAGTILGVSAQNVIMLIAGRLLLGFGVGFANQAAPIYITEMAPPRWRGTLSTSFQFFLCSGSVAASFINFAANSFHDNRSWQLALGCAAIPAIILTVGTFFIPDTPSSLIQRGKKDEALVALLKVRSSKSEAEEELENLIRHSEAQKSGSQCKKLWERRYRPQMVLTVLIPLFQQFTGVSLVAFYGSVLMRMMGFGASGALMAAVVLGVVNLGSVLMSTYLIDRVGRRFLFLQGGVQILLSHVAIGCTLAIQAQNEGGHLSTRAGLTVLVLMCFISAAFGWSWGPLTWLVPSEILPTELRAAGSGICIATNFITTFFLAQLTLTLLCHMKFGLFFFYGATTLLMTVFIGLFLPETKGVPLESMDDVWRNHWYWKRFVPA